MGKGLIVGFVLGTVVGGLLVYGARQRHDQMLAAGWTTTKVVVAGAAMKAGSPIRMDALAQRPIPDQFLTGSVVRAKGAQGVVGKRTLIDLAPGDPIRSTALVHPLPEAVCALACGGGAKPTGARAPAPKTPPAGP